MNASANVLALVLLATACGRPPASDESEAETSTEESTSTEDSTTGLYIVVPDVEEIIQCDMFAQECPEGEKCVPYGSTGGNFDDNKCVPVKGDVPTGEPCTYDGTLESTDDCDATGFCWNGTCHVFCQGNAENPVCPEDSTCHIKSDGSMLICIPQCDPLGQDCAEGTTCYWTGSDFGCIFTTMNLPPGAPCGYINDCVQGSVCLAAEVLPMCDGSACCTPWCQLGLGDAQCAAVPGTVCSAFFEEGMAAPGYDQLGVCIL